MNNLLERLEAAFERERDGLPGMPLELHTPIAELKTLTEVGLKNASQAPDMRTYFEDAWSSQTTWNRS